MTQQPFYPQAPAAYPPAPPAQQYPQQPAAPQYPGYPPQQAYGAPAPQQYAPAPQQPAQPLATGTIDDFYNQPTTGGGKSLKFDQIGTRYIGIVTRPIGNGDIQQQTDIQGRPQHFRDGRPKFVMKVPLQMQPSAEYPDGLAQWFVKGQARDELARAMAEAGCPEDVRVPEPNSIIDVTFTGTRSSGAGMNPAKLFAIRYTRPEGAASAAPTQPAPQVAAPAAPVEVPAQAAAPGTYPPAPAAQPIPQQVPQQFQPQQAAPPAAAPAQVQQAPAPQPPADLNPDQQALLARLTGQQG
jgi:hypothetical protein